MGKWWCCVELVQLHIWYWKMRDSICAFIQQWLATKLLLSSVGLGLTSHGHCASSFCCLQGSTKFVQNKRRQSHLVSLWSLDRITVYTFRYSTYKNCLCVYVGWGWSKSHTLMALWWCWAQHHLVACLAQLMTQSHINGTQRQFNITWIQALKASCTDKATESYLSGTVISVISEEVHAMFHLHSVFDGGNSQGWESANFSGCCQWHHC